MRNGPITWKPDEKCPQCGLVYIFPDRRKIQEGTCGHYKCYECLKISSAGCLLCVDEQNRATQKLVAAASPPVVIKEEQVPQKQRNQLKKVTVSSLESAMKVHPESKEVSKPRFAPISLGMSFNQFKNVAVGVDGEINA